MKASVETVRKSGSQNFGTRKPRENKCSCGPQFRVPKFWDTDTLYKPAFRQSAIPCPKMLGHGNPCLGGTWEPRSCIVIIEIRWSSFAISTMATDRMMVRVAPSWSTTRRWLSRCDGGPAIGLLSRGHDYHHVVSRHCTEARSSVSQNFGKRKCGVPNPLLARCFRAPNCWDTELRTGATLAFTNCHEETVARSLRE